MAEALGKRSSLTRVQRILQRYWIALDEVIRVDRLVLFGSYARGTPHRDSDIDVAIISRDFTGRPFDDADRIMKTRWDIDLRIEPHLFRPEDYHLDNPLAAEVIEKGIPIRRPALPRRKRPRPQSRVAASR